MARERHGFSRHRSHRVGSDACNALIDDSFGKIRVLPVYRPVAVATIRSNRPKGKKRFKGATGRCPAFATT